MMVVSMVMLDVLGVELFLFYIFLQVLMVGVVIWVILKDGSEKLILFPS